MGVSFQPAVVQFFFFLTDKIFRFFFFRATAVLKRTLNRSSQKILSDKTISHENSEATLRDLHFIPSLTLTDLPRLERKTSLTEKLKERCILRNYNPRT